MSELHAQVEKGKNRNVYTDEKLAWYYFQEIATNAKGEEMNSEHNILFLPPLRERTRIKQCHRTNSTSHESDAFPWSPPLKYPPADAKAASVPNSFLHCQPKIGVGMMPLSSLHSLRWNHLYCMCGVCKTLYHEALKIAAPIIPSKGNDMMHMIQWQLPLNFVNEF